MKSFRKILYLFLIIFTLSFSIDGEKSKVVLDKRYDTAKLKIGVTKLISKELPLEFHAESKKIYGEIDIDENDLVFVSETLDEMPSVSTTNGRKAINNIKKYLTKEIKKSPKFEYRIVEEKPEADKTEGKKYLLIDCKEQLSGVYVYVVEKGSYKVKEVYKGVFRQLFTVKSDITYGTIAITKNMFDTKRFREISFDGISPVISKIGLSEKDEEASKHILIQGNYPQKVKDGNKFDDEWTPLKKPAYEIVVEGNGESYTSGYKMLSGNNLNIIDGTFKLNTKESVGGTELRIQTKEDSEYYHILVKQPYPYDDVKYKITVNYGEKRRTDNDFDLVESHTFDLEIISQGNKPLLPQNTEGTVFLKNKVKHGSLRDSFLKFEKSNDGKDTVTLDSYSSLFLNEKGYPSLVGKGVEILDYAKYRDVFSNTDENYLLITYNSNGGKTSTKKIMLNNSNLNNGNIELDENKVGSIELYNLNGIKLGDMVITGKFEKDKKNCFEIKFKASDLPADTKHWSDVYRDTVSKLEFKYYSKSPDGEDDLLKNDTLNLVIYPVDEVIARETRGTLLITKSEGLPNKDLFVKNGVLQVETNASGGKEFDIANASFKGQLPMAFASNNDIGQGKDYWVNYEVKDNYRLRIEGLRTGVIETVDVDMGTGNPTGEFDFKTGSFRSKKSGSNGWIDLRNENGIDIGRIYFSYKDDDGKNKESITIGFRWGYTGGDHDDFAWGDDTGFYERYQFKYQISPDGKEWKTIKTDILELIIQKSLSTEESKIDLKNPLVYYDYDSSSAISNIVHNRRAHLAKDDTKTLNNSGAEFKKNTDLAGKQWIETAKINDYDFLGLKKHKISIARGNDEVMKNTREDGGTLSSTYLKGNDTGSVSGTKNEVMFSYDGGNKYLNFGLSKYNFDGEEKGINNIVITHFDNSGQILKERRVYNVSIPAFEGIHYVGNYDIKPRQSYTKNYEYRKDILYNESVIIDYGTVGFRNLDTRITEQSGGDGIDFRAATKVKLVSTKKDSNYVIKGARLYFDGDENKVIGTGTPIETSVFKGENEKSTSKMLKLYIPRQETLIPQGKFKILVDDENDSEKNNKNPLKVGVTVNNNTDKYYTYIGANERGQRGEDLYLNLTVNRFIETRIEFENPELKNDDTGKENWIKLNESDYPNGELTRDINGSNIWGRVRGDVINIPTEYKDASGNLTKKYNLKMTLFDKDGKELINDLNTANGEYKFELSSSTTNNKRYFIISRENPDNNFIRFTLDNGYNCNDQGKPPENPLEFYIRYIDTTTKDDSIKKEGDFLFDQRYIVDFKKKADYKGNITLRFKNPAMTEKENTQTNKDGLIDLFKKDYLTDSKGNHNTTQDSIDWVNIGGISSNIINEIKNDLVNDYQLNDIDEPTKNITAETVKSFIKNLDADKFVVGLSREKTKFENLFGAYNGQKIDKSFELKFGNDNSRAYRINVIIDKFDPRYYGKVFVKDKDDTANYEEINSVGEGKIDLTDDNNLQTDKFVYVDLGTSYRNYMRYEALPTSILNKGLSVRVGGEVEAIPVNSNYEKSVTGEIVLFDENNYISLTEDGKSIEFSDKIPKSYSMKLKLSLEQYKKLRPYTKYEIFLNGNPNVLTIGTDTLKENILFDKPLSFTTEGPALKIKTNILDFGQIKPKEEKEQLITKSAKTEILVEITNTLDTNLGVTTQDLVPETDTIYINQVSADGTLMENGEELKVRDLKTTKTKTISPKGTGTTIETYELSGTLEVRKDIPEENYGEYRGKVMVEYTFY